MGFFTRSTSKQTARLKSLVKIAVARLAVVRRPRLGRRSIARGDVAQLLSIGHLDRALVRVRASSPSYKSLVKFPLPFPSSCVRVCVW